MADYKYYEWTKPQWESLLAKPEGLHHAMLLAGPAGVGKSAFAEALAARLLCEKVESPTAFACGHCDACHWFATGNHPDIRKVSLEKDDEAENETDTETEGKRTTGGKKTAAKATQIRIDQIRELEEFIFVGSHRHGNRVAVIDPADLMNTPAANSLLKILEEPPSNTYFILVSSRWRVLLPTLRSRCRQLLFALPEQDVGVAWLADQGVSDPKIKLSLAGGAPLRVLTLSGKENGSTVEPVLAPLDQSAVDPLGLAALWHSLLRSNDNLTLESLVDTLQKWLYDLIRVKLNAHPKYMINKMPLLSNITKKADLSKLTRCYGDLLKIRMVANHPLNTLLFLEDLAARYATAVAGSRS